MSEFEPIVNIANSVAHTFLQLAAVPLGVANDWLFERVTTFLRAHHLYVSEQSSPIIKNVSDAIRVGIEASLQVVTSGLLVAGVMSYLSSLPYELSDPSGGSLFIILLFASQPQWRTKLEALIQYTRKEWNIGTSVVEAKVRDWQRNANSAMNSKNRAQTSAVEKNVGMAVTNQGSYSSLLAF